MNPTTSRDHRSQTATTSARSPARIITYTITLRRAYDALTSPSTRNIDKNPHTIAMGHCISTTTASTSTPGSSSLAGTATTTTDLTDAKGQLSKATHGFDNFVKTLRDFNSHHNPISLPKWKRRVASENTVPTPGPVGGLRGSGKRRKTAALFVLKKPADYLQNENKNGLSTQQQPTAGFDYLASKALPPTPPSSTPTSHKNSATTTTASNRTATAKVPKAEPIPNPSLTITAPPTPPLKSPPPPKNSHMRQPQLRLNPIQHNPLPHPPPRTLGFQFPLHLIHVLVGRHAGPAPRFFRRVLP